MIVDDERLVRWSLRQKCEEWGYHVIEADSGVPALKLAQQESPDLVLLDVRMPDLTGIEVLDQLKKSGDARAVIMITADPQLDDVKAALKLGPTTSWASRSISTSFTSPSRTRSKPPACAPKSKPCAAKCAAEPVMTAWSASPRR